MKTSNKVLSPFPYYGGKARMSKIICNMLDYDNTDLYIEPFGGGCRTLLNKKRHDAEIYNDFGYGLTTFFSVMQDQDKLNELIEQLTKNPPTREMFDELVLERMEDEDRLNTSTNTRLKSLLIGCKRRTPHKYFNDCIKAINHEDYDVIVEVLEKILGDTYCLGVIEPLEEEQIRKYYKLYTDFWNKVREDVEKEVKVAKWKFDVEWNQRIATTQDTRKQFELHRDRFVKQIKTSVINRFTDEILNSNESGSTVSDVRMAFMIFQLYYSSRDGMGNVWSEKKNRDIRAYYRAVNNLYNIAERIRDVIITQVDALDLIRQYRVNDNVMIYLDPSYLKPKDEHRNLGIIYKMSYTYEDHEKLLKEITKPDTMAKVLISNYDVALYNDYLADWNKTYFRTTTGVGSKKNNKRVEVLWKNY